MSWPQIHLALNHFPIVGIFFSILFWAVALFKKQKRLLTLGLYFFIIIAVITLPVWLSGDPAAEVMKTMPGISKAQVEAHNEAGEQARTVACILGVVALAGLIGWRGKPEFPRWFLYAVLALALLCATSLFWTAFLGGKIHHQELAGLFSTTWPTGW
jgi:uncharacterized membrane protein